MAEIIVILLLLLFCAVLAAIMVWCILALAASIIDLLREMKE